MPRSLRRARKARTFTSVPLQPVMRLISATDPLLEIQQIDYQPVLGRQLPQ